MDKNYDKQKMLEILVNPDVSMILSELEDGSKDSIYLVEKLQISETEIKERLAYAIQYGFVKLDPVENKTIYTVNQEKLNDIMEMDENFSGVVDGLTELDQYLN
jgi:glucose-6-phosphate-specific signal transduction histidine kinase